MTTHAPSRRKATHAPDLDGDIAEARAQAVVIWRGERIAFAALPERIARIDDRETRDRLYTSYQDAVEALNPLYEKRLDGWMQAGDLVAEATARDGIDPSQLAVDLERFSLHSETAYYAALRRYLALIGIEQGDATEADLWHVIRGTEWDAWFGEREVAAAVAAAGRNGNAGELDGWRAAESRLGADPQTRERPAAAAARQAYATLVGSPDWLTTELSVAPDEAIAFVDFAAFVRLWRFRRLVALLTYELRLYATTDRAIRRAYYAGILGHITGVMVPEAEYLIGVDAPFASVSKLEASMLAAMLVEVLEQRHGTRWWRDPASVQLVERFAASANREDALAELGYDALDWRPVLRQIRTRLIGEMSGYGGPNITTRAGTRKV